MLGSEAAADLDQLCGAIEGVEARTSYSTSRIPGVKEQDRTFWPDSTGILAGHRLILG